MSYDPHPGEILEVLEAHGWRSTSKSRGRATGKCIFHEDGKASFSVNTETNTYKCHAASCPNSSGGGIKDVWAHYGMPNLFAEGKRDEEDAELLKSNLWSEDGAEALRILHDRGFTDLTLRAFDIGVSFRLRGAELAPPYRITIPIYDEHSKLGYYRRYHPDGVSNEPAELFSRDNPSKRTEPKGRGGADADYDIQCPSCTAFFKITRKDTGNLVECPDCHDKLQVVGSARKMSFQRGSLSLLYGCNKISYYRNEQAAVQESARVANGPSIATIDPPTTVFIVEGEWDRLIMEQHGLPAGTGTGSGTWKDEWTPMFDGLDVVVLYDNDKAGEKGATKVREALQKRGKCARLRVPRWPFREDERLHNGAKPKDACDWFKLGHTPEEIWDFVDNAESFALQPAPVVVETYSVGEHLEGVITPINRRAMVSKIDEARTTKGVDSYEQRRLISETIIQDLSANGKFIKTKNDDFYYFSRTSRRLYTLCDKHFKSLINVQYRVNSTEQEYRFLEQDIVDYANIYGEQMLVRKFCHFDREKMAVYISQYNGGMAKITARGWEVIDNGSDAVFFLDSTQCDPWAFSSVVPNDVQSAIPELMRYITDISFDENMCLGKIQSNLLLLWLISIFFGSEIKARPLCTFLGAKGSGKTVALRRFLRLFYGPDADVTSVRPDSQDDLQAAIMSGFLVVFDNIDNESEFMNDELAKIATGQVILRRELYTTLASKSFKPDCFVGITSHTPHFTRSDVIDRMLIFRVARRDEFSNESDTIALQNRGDFFSAMIPVIQAVLKLYAAGKRSTKSKYRLADWSTFSAMTALALGMSEEEADEHMRISQQMRIDLQVEEDPLIGLIARWLSEDKTRLLTPYSASKLASEWNAIVKEDGMRFRYHSKHVGRKIKDAMSALSRRWIVTVDKDPVENVETFTFAKRNAADPVEAAKYAYTKTPEALRLEAAAKEREEKEIKKVLKAAEADDGNADGKPKKKGEPDGEF